MSILSLIILFYAGDSLAIESLGLIGNRSQAWLVMLVTACAALAVFRFSSSRKNTTYYLPIAACHNERCYYFADLKQPGYFSTGLCNMLGMTENKVLAQEALSAEDAHRFSQLCNVYTQLLTDLVQNIQRVVVPLSSDIKICLYLPGDKKRYFYCSGDIVCNHRHKPSGYIIWFHDITEEVVLNNKLIAQNYKLTVELEKLNKVLNAAPFPIWERDQNLNISYFNFAYSLLIAQETDKALESNSLELDKQSRQLAKLAHDSAQAQAEERYIVVSGERYLFNITEVPVANDTLVGFAVDMSSREKIKQELDRYISAQSDLLEGSASAMAIYSADTRIQYFNQAFVRLWGLDERWLLTHPTYGEILEELREKRKLPEQANFPAFKQKHLKLFTELLTPNNEFFYLPDGKALRVLVIPHALGGLLFAYEDMTDHLALERLYNTLIAVQKATLDNLHEGVAVFGENGRLKLSNPIYAKLWQLDPEYLHRGPHLNELMDHIKIFFHDEDEWRTLRHNLLRPLDRRAPTHIIMERSDGITIKRISIPLPDGAFLITHLDITDSKLVEKSLRERNQALQDSDRIKTEFLANVSYELRSPLTSIMGFSEALDKQYFGGLSPHQQEYVTGIYQSSQYLMSLINDILDLASIEAGYLKLDITKFNLKKAINSLLPLIKERVKKSAITLKFNCDLQNEMMMGDEKRIKQVVFKLLSNAIKFSHEVAGRIVLDVCDIGPDQISICVEDNGIGIAPEDLEFVFNKFYKKNSTKLDKSGAGLGLSVVKNFIELHGGKIIIESGEGGRGTKISCLIARESSELVKPSFEIIEKTTKEEKILLAVD